MKMQLPISKSRSRRLHYFFPTPAVYDDFCPVGSTDIYTTASADFSQFVITTANEAVCETSRNKPASLSPSTCLIYAYGLRLPFGLYCFQPAYPP